MDRESGEVQVCLRNIPNKDQKWLLGLDLKLVDIRIYRPYRMGRVDDTDDVDDVSWPSSFFT